MKKLLLLITLITSLNSFTYESNEQNQTEISPVIQSLLDAGVESSAGNYSSEDKQFTCYAYVNCLSGMPAYCTSWGQGCTAVRLFNRVTCTGYNAAGMWTTWTAWCN